MKSMKSVFIFFLFFFLEGIIYVHGIYADSGNELAAHATGAVINDTISGGDSSGKNDSPVKYFEKDGELFFYGRLIWDEAVYAVRYMVVMEQKIENLDTYREILRVNSEQTYLDINVPPGEYRFMVMSYNILGLLDAQTEWDYFTVHNPITLLQPRSGVALSNNPLSPSSVIWSTEMPLQNSRVIFSREPDPTKDPRAIVQYVAQDTKSINLPALGEGIWYWTVLGDTSDGLSVSATVPLWFTLLSMPLLSSPQYIRPGSDEVITLKQLTADRKITFEWETVPEANAYIFSLFGYSDKQELLVFSSPSPETSFELTNLTILKVEKYIWQVEAVYVSRSGTIERRGILLPQTFDLNVQRSGTLRNMNPGTTYGF